MSRSSLAPLSFLILACLSLSTPAAALPELWVGFGQLFEKASYADWTLPANHDSITPAVKLARQDIQGMFNLAQEDGYQGGENAPSPVDTEWAFGRAHDWESITFMTWTDWVRSDGGPQQTVGRDAVLHLISDDIYIDLRFLSYEGGNSGGAYSYIRATPDTPVEPGSASRLKALYLPEG